MEPTPQYDIVLIADSPASLSYEQLVAQAAAKTWAVATYLLASVHAYNACPYVSRNGKAVSGYSAYNIHVWDVRTSNFSQPNGRLVVELGGDSPASCLAELERELTELEFELNQETA